MGGQQSYPKSRDSPKRDCVLGSCLLQQSVCVWEWSVRVRVGDSNHSRVMPIGCLCSAPLCWDFLGIPKYGWT